MSRPSNNTRGHEVARRTELIVTRVGCSAFHPPEGTVAQYCWNQCSALSFEEVAADCVHNNLSLYFISIQNFNSIKSMNGKVEVLIEF